MKKLLLFFTLISSNAFAEYKLDLNINNIKDPAFDAGLKLIQESDLFKYFLSPTGWPAIIFAVVIIFQLTRLIGKYTEMDFSWRDVYRFILTLYISSTLLGYLPFPKILNFNKSSQKTGDFILVSNLNQEFSKLGVIIHNSIPHRENQMLSLSRMARLAQISQNFCAFNNEDEREKCIFDYVKKFSKIEGGKITVLQKDMIEAEIQFSEAYPCQITNLSFCVQNILGFSPSIGEFVFSGVRILLYLSNTLGYIIFYTFMSYNDYAIIIILIILKFTTPLIIIPEMTGIVINSYKEIFKFTLLPVLFSLIVFITNIVLIAQLEVGMSLYMKGQLPFIDLMYYMVFSSASLVIAEIILMLKSMSFAALFITGTVNTDSAAFFNTISRKLKGALK